MSPAATTRCGVEGISVLPYLCSMVIGKPSPAGDTPGEMESELPQPISRVVADSPPLRNCRRVALSSTGAERASRAAVTRFTP